MSYARIAQDENDEIDADSHAVEIHENVRTLADVDADRSNGPPIVYSAIEKPINQSVSPSNTQSANQSNKDSIMISLTFIQQNEPNRKVLCNPSWTISQVKQEVFPEALKQGKLVRLIYLGRVLADTATLSSLNIETDHVIHAMVTDKIPVAEPVTTAPRNVQSNDFYDTRGPAFIHTSPDQSYNDADSDIDINDERYVASHASDYIPPEPPVGTNAEFAFGFVLGFVMGFLALIWLWSPQTPRKQRMGIYLGMACHLFLNTLNAEARQQHAARPTEADP